MPWYTNRSGEQLWYEDQGRGCPVVLLHGWCMSSAVWKYQLEAVSSTLRLVAPDLRGHGRSREISGGLNFDRLAEDLTDLLNFLKLTKVILVGWSMGGQLALHASVELTERLAGMVLVSATPCFTAVDGFPYGLSANETSGMRLKVQRNLKRALDGFHTRLFAEGELEGVVTAPEIIQLLSTQPLPDVTNVLEALETLCSTDLRPLLKLIDLPVLVVNGAQDRICLPQASNYLQSHIPGAEQRVYPHCGHAPFLTYSRQFNAELTLFTRSLCEQNA